MTSYFCFLLFMYCIQKVLPATWSDDSVENHKVVVKTLYIPIYKGGSSLTIPFLKPSKKSRNQVKISMGYGSAKQIGSSDYKSLLEPSSQEILEVIPQGLFSSASQNSFSRNSDYNQKRTTRSHEPRENKERDYIEQINYSKQDKPNNNFRNNQDYSSQSNYPRYQEYSQQSNPSRERDYSHQQSNYQGQQEPSHQSSYNREHSYSQPNHERHQSYSSPSTESKSHVAPQPQTPSYSHSHLPHSHQNAQSFQSYDQPVNQNRLPDIQTGFQPIPHQPTTTYAPPSANYHSAPPNMHSFQSSVSASLTYQPSYQNGITPSGQNEVNYSPTAVPITNHQFSYPGSHPVSSSQHGYSYVSTHHDPRGAPVTHQTTVYQQPSEPQQSLPSLPHPHSQNYVSHPSHQSYHSDRQHDPSHQSYMPQHYSDYRPNTYTGPTHQNPVPETYHTTSQQVYAPPPPPQRPSVYHNDQSQSTYSQNVHGSYQVMPSSEYPTTSSHPSHHVHHHHQSPQQYYQPTYQPDNTYQSSVQYSSYPSYQSGSQQPVPSSYVNPSAPHYQSGYQPNY